MRLIFTQWLDGSDITTHSLCVEVGFKDQRFEAYNVISDCELESAKHNACDQLQSLNHLPLSMKVGAE